MRTLTFPENKLLNYKITGKFKAPNDSWKHELFHLTEYELFVITEGTLYLSYNNEDFTINAGEYLLLPPSKGWRQGFKNAYSSFYWLHFECPAFSDGDAAYSIPQSGSLPHIEKLAVLMKQLQDMVKSGYPGIALNAMTTAIMTELYGQLALLPPISDNSENLKQVYNDIIDYIERNLSRNVKVSEIAQVFGYNEKYLSHRFQQLTGISLKQYIIKIKIDSANFMLSDTNKSITDIATELGFSDSHNFARAYKKSTGLTPSEYRNAFSKRLLFQK